MTGNETMLLMSGVTDLAWLPFQTSQFSLFVRSFMGHLTFPCMHGYANLMQPWQSFQVCLRLKCLHKSGHVQTLNQQPKKLLACSGRICGANFNHTVLIRLQSNSIFLLCEATVLYWFIFSGNSCVVHCCFLFLCYYCIWGALVLGLVLLCNPFTYRDKLFQFNSNGLLVKTYLSD